MPNPKPPSRPRNSSISSRAISAATGFPASKALNQPNPHKSRPASRQPPANSHEATSIQLDPWLTSAPLPQGQPLASLIAALASGLPKVRTDARLRQLDVLACLLANFAASAALASTTTAIKAIAVPLRRDKSSRYDNPSITGRQLKPVIDALEDAGMIVRTPAIFKQRRTIVEPTARLAELVAQHQVTTASITRLSGEEVIILRQRKARNADGEGHGDVEPLTTNNQDGALIDYPNDCLEANALRNELRRYNAFISKSDICVLGIDNPPPPKPFKRLFDTSGPVQFNLHGRVYAGQVGGWHQNLPKAERHLVRINGEQIVEIDFNALHVRLAYCEANCTPPAEDLYATPGLEPYRPALKIVVSAMLSITGELTKLPPTVREASPDLPKHWTAKRIAQAVKEYHAPIVHLFGKDKGIAFMHNDSTILMLVLTRLLHLGIPALPLHDAVLVQASARDIATAVMKEASKELLGVELPVGVKSY